MATTTAPLCVFGVISDVQYGDLENGRSFTGIERHYRYARDCLKQVRYLPSPYLRNFSSEVY